MSRGSKTNDDSSDLQQKTKTVTKYARRVSGVRIDIEVIVQIHKFDV